MRPFWGKDSNRIVCNHSDMSVKISPALQTLFQSDLSLSAFVSTAISKIENHISSNQLVFFPEYTDHSIRHIELTLQTAFDLTTKAARELMTPVDAAALIVAVGLHDVGMFLTRDGFLSLIAKNSQWKGVTFFDKRDWSTLWDEFYSEATRFDDRKLKQLFGAEYRPVQPLPPLSSPWDDLDYLLVGEFLRRHHARLAHEIALYGLPAKNGNAIKVCPSDTGEQNFLADIAGVIARSHGIDLRNCLEYMQDKYQNKINPRGIHAAFLATLLRIADYFQIQATRAPSAHTDVTSFKSQLSEIEWNVHQSVKDIHNTSSDPEALVIIAEPTDVETFLRLKNWLHGLQNELDQSWAILGEVYGLQHHNHLNSLGIKIRRIKSNIDATDEFAKTVSFVPAKITFEAANADLLKLLVAPLYGNRPGAGLRELIQNAVDAVREFDDLATIHPELLTLTRYDQKSEVHLEIKGDESKKPIEIIITDRGVGMSLSVIRDYFLKAGASFRKSSSWRKEHEDDKGHSRVLRTGRFGVGALAAYLLGDEIEVTTRHVYAEENNGITFTARLDDEALSLTRVSCPIGTRIRIKIPGHLRESVAQIIPYKWQNEINFSHDVGHYFLKYPSLVRSFPDQRQIPLQGWLPQIDDDVSADWRWFSNDHFDKVFWSFDNEYPSLACNGIVVTAQAHIRNLWEYVETPQLSVFDKDGQLPVNLQRTGLQDALPFKGDLLKSIGEDICAHALNEAPEDVTDIWFSGKYEGFSSRDLNIYNPDLTRWFLSKDGFILNEPNLLAEFNPKTILIALGGPNGYSSWIRNLLGKIPNNVLIASTLPFLFSETDVRIKGMVRRLAYGDAHGPLGTTGKVTQVYIPEVIIEKAKGMNPGKDVSRALEKLARSPQKKRMDTR